MGVFFEQIVNIMSISFWRQLFTQHTIGKKEPKILVFPLVNSWQNATYMGNFDKVLRFQNWEKTKIRLWLIFSRAKSCNVALQKLEKVGDFLCKGCDFFLDWWAPLWQEQCLKNFSKNALLFDQINVQYTCTNPSKPLTSIWFV